jgi:two-component system sensor histidine kinase KdpD
VDDGGYLSEEDHAMLETNLALARDLGAEVITTNDPDLVEGIERIARQKGATQIVIGRPPKPWFLGIFQVPTLLDRLAIKCRSLDIHVIRQDRMWSPRYWRKRVNPAPQFTQSYSYLIVIGVVALMTVGSSFFLPYIGYKVVGFMFLLSILGLSLFVKKGPIFLASILSAFAWDYFFVPSQGSPESASGEDIALLVLYLLTAIVTGILTDRAREHKEMLA